MRLLITTDTVGGVWTFTQELSAGLLEQGCSVALVSLGGLPGAYQSAWAGDMTCQWGDRFLFTPTDVPLEWMQNNQTAYTDAEALLLRLARSFGADAIHSNQFCFGALPGKLPRIVTAHSDVFSWAQACGHSPLPPSEWIEQYRNLVAKGLRDCDAVVAPTRWMLEAIAASFALPEQRDVIPNGRTLTAPSRERKLQAITAGRVWDQAKGISLLDKVHSSIPLFCAGESHSSDGHRPSSSVHMLGPLSGEDLLARFAESAIYLCTSIYEPFGLAPLEAALCGCAVLANNMPSLREVWQEGALYFNDTESLSALLDSLSSNPERLQQAQARSLEQARRYTRTAMTASYLNLFEKVIAQSREQMRVA